MTQYIDADNIVYWTRRDVRKVAFSDEIARVPTADVVPKSEVEWLEKEVDRLSQVVLYHDTFKIDEIKDAKTDVAREIFAEIEDLMREWFDFFRQDNDIRESCAIMAALSQITELKKKYTEETYEKA